MNFLAPQMWGISWIAEELLAFQQGLCSLELVMEFAFTGYYWFSLQKLVSLADFKKEVSLWNQYCKRYTPWRSTNALPRRSLLPKCHAVTRYTRKCNFIRAHKRLRHSVRRFAPDPHTTHTYSTALCGNLLYQISPKSDKKCGKYG
jgi:hypothetical protein